MNKSLITAIFSRLALFRDRRSLDGGAYFDVTVNRCGVFKGRRLFEARLFTRENTVF